LYDDIWILVDDAWNTGKYSGHELIGILERIKLELRDGIEKTGDEIEEIKLTKKHEKSKDNEGYIG